MAPSSQREEEGILHSDQEGGAGSVSTGGREGRGLQPGGGVVVKAKGNHAPL